ncbi:MAG: ATP-dependent protease, partial [Candidatus Jettenia caeni]|nr:ATP-dependent protease [Candidatus Jettenia caeni]
LMLREDVIEAVILKKFTIWAVNTIDEGIELLTGVTSGDMQNDGTFPPDTVNEKVSRQLADFEKALKRSKDFLGNVSGHRVTS